MTVSRYSTAEGPPCGLCKRPPSAVRPVFAFSSCSTDSYPICPECCHSEHNQRLSPTCPLCESFRIFEARQNGRLGV